ncbi:MAG TPA: GIY-YIG nuclease family protein [Gammaproteobacteria bacterium]|jgi:putative endonuclease|nr:GIY-YIG nuclease family protein [Gammaproteobacteria bacterium]
MKSYCVYLLLCNNGAYYTGYTDNLEKRYQLHLSGKASKYTRAFKPVKIARVFQVGEDKSEAMRLEKRIKSLSKAKKLVLIKKPAIHVDELLASLTCS